MSGCAIVAAGAALCVSIQAFGWDGDGGAAVEPVRALIITGQQNHNWQYTSRYHKDTLEESGRFVVDITDDPAKALADAGALKRYGLLVMDFNSDKRWGDPAETNFLNAVRDGTGVVIIHASNNAFIGWTEYEKMCALMWVKDTTGHGSFHSFDVRYTDHDHPITRGLADMKDHPDELYHKLVNTQGSKIQLLATALSATDAGGTGNDEPMALVLSYGKGRVFHTPLGHVWTNSDPQKASIADPQFKILLARGAEWAATGQVTLGTTWAEKREHNRLTAEEQKDGWQSLFDGKTPASFRGFKQTAMPAEGWVVENGAIRHVAGKGGGDIVTREQYDSFEFACDWKIAPGGNSGIMYHVGENHDNPWETGPEMQVLDNARHADGKNPKTSAGSLYALVACKDDVVRPAGEWNHARIVVKGTHVEHWMNGFKEVEYDLGSPEWKAMVEDSKFKAMPDFGKPTTGVIALQDHGDDVWYRDVKVRRLK